MQKRLAYLKLNLKLIKRTSSIIKSRLYNLFLHAHKSWINKTLKKIYGCKILDSYIIFFFYNISQSITRRYTMSAIYLDSVADQSFANISINSVSP